MWSRCPGALRLQRPHSEFFNAQDSLSTNVNGQSRLANNVQIEGIDDNHRTGLLTTLIPSAEAIETVNISTSAYDAEFGRAGGAITNVTLKSGHERFQGERLRVRQQREDERAGLFHAHAIRPATTCRAGSRWAGRCGRTRCSSSATISTSRQRRPDDARHHSADGVPHRRLQRIADEDLRSGDRQPGRHGTARRSRTTSSPPIGSARSRRRFSPRFRRRTSRRRSGRRTTRLIRRA